MQAKALVDFLRKWVLQQMQISSALHYYCDIALSLEVLFTQIFFSNKRYQKKNSAHNNFFFGSRVRNILKIRNS